MIFPDLKFVQAHGHGGNRGETQMVVMHCTDNTASDEAEASYATWRPDGTSAHFYNDDDSVIQSLDTNVVAYGCYPIGNSKSVQFEMTGRSNQISDATMRRVASTVARVCQAYGIPIRKVGPQDLRNGSKGICGHGDVTRAWGQGDHTDPGDSFPWTTFIGYVAAAAGQAPTPPPSHSAPPWPLPRNEYFGHYRGPNESHGGVNAGERPHIAKIQNALNAKGYNCGTADGWFGDNTQAAVSAWQGRNMPGTTYYGQVWWDDWAKLLG